MRIEAQKEVLHTGNGQQIKGRGKRKASSQNPYAIWEGQCKGPNLSRIRSRIVGEKILVPWVSKEWFGGGVGGNGGDER